MGQDASQPSGSGDTQVATVKYCAICGCELISPRDDYPIIQVAVGKPPFPVVEVCLICFRIHMAMQERHKRERSDLRSRQTWELAEFFSGRWNLSMLPMKQLIRIGDQGTFKIGMTKEQLVNVVRQQLLSSTARISQVKFEIDPHIII